MHPLRLQKRGTAPSDSDPDFSGAEAAEDIGSDADEDEEDDEEDDERSAKWAAWKAARRAWRGAYRPPECPNTRGSGNACL